MTKFIYNVIFLITSVTKLVIGCYPSNNIGNDCSYGYFPCLNGGTCDFRQFYASACICQAGFYGPRCEFGISANVTVAVVFGVVIIVLLVLGIIVCIYLYCKRKPIQTNDKNQTKTTDNHLSRKPSISSSSSDYYDQTKTNDISMRV